MTLQEKINNAVEIIKHLDLNNLPVGKTIVNEDFYYSIQEYDTKLIENCKLEAHKNYVDIQYIIEGREAIDIRDISTLKLQTEYNPEKDVSFYETSEIMQRIELTSGSYAVFLPETAHKPGIAINNIPSKVKKCVGKVRI